MEIRKYLLKNQEMVNNVRAKGFVCYCRKLFLSFFQQVVYQRYKIHIQVWKAHSNKFRLLAETAYVEYSDGVQSFPRGYVYPNVRVKLIAHICDDVHVPI